MNKTVFFVLVAALLCAGAVSVYLSTASFTPQERPAIQSRVASAVPIGGPFELVDHNGQNVNDQSYGDRYKLMFFGFTSCPDVCPAELNKIATVLDGLGADAERIKPLFVTIDPERDTPEVMKEYVELFHPDITGLTGTVAQIEEVEETYKVYSAKSIIEGMAEGDYMVDHSAFTYLMSPDNELILVFDGEDETDQIVAEIREIL